MNSLDEINLVTAASEAAQNAYAPYSNFRVGAALRTSSGAIHVGCNSENAAYPEGWCAETAALAVMVTAGERVIVEIAVYSDAVGHCPPCGGCRQRIAEFSTPDTLIRLVNHAGDVQLWRLDELLPNKFAKDHIS
jgi:cytidine deaminase